MLPSPRHLPRLLAFLMPLAIGLAGLAIALAHHAHAHGDATAIQRGQALYQDTCAGCHGRALQGGLAPALGASSSATKLTHAQLHDLIKRGRGAMPAMGATFTSASVNDLIAYLNSAWQPRP